jgi:uncharacterized protein with HEPN domain
MKKREQSDQARLIHMRDAAKKAIQFVDGKKRESLDEDEMLLLALVALLAIIGEAAGNLTRSFRDDHPEIPWALIIGTRHRVIHAYYEVDADIVWDTATKNLPELLRQLDAILADDIDPQ